MIHAHTAAHWGQRAGASVFGCASQPVAWQRVDGRAPTDLAQAQTICEGEMQKANLSAGQAAGIIPGRGMIAVYDGWMAAHGYMKNG